MNLDDPKINWGQTFNNPWKDFKIPEKKIRTSCLAVDELALKYGWVSDWGDFVPVEVYDLLKECSEVANCDEEQEQLISKFFIEYYSYQNFQDIQHMVEDWISNHVFKKRIHIFRDCLYALQIQTPSFNSSILVVPALISQIDGIIKEILEREGCKFNSKERKWTHPNFNYKENSVKCFGYMIGNKRNCLGVTYIGKLVQTNSRRDILIEELFQKALHGDKLENPEFISRNKILHGEDVNYGTLKNTLQLFLLLDYLKNFDVSKLTEPDDSDIVEYR